VAPALAFFSRREVTMTPLKVFIGSSTQALPVVDRLVSIMGTMRDTFDPLPWNHTGVLESDVHFLESLEKLTEKVDAAVLVFAEDDRRLGSEGDLTGVARDNVILEWGLFDGVLGRERVSIFKEHGIKLPSDLSGLKVQQFDRKSGAPVLEAQLKGYLTQLKGKWETLPPRARARLLPEVDSVGIVETIHKGLENLRGIETTFWGLQHSPARESQQPIHLRPAELCVQAYIEGLRKVTRRFWTTTYLGSGFWGAPELQISEKIKAANKEMMARLGPLGPAADLRRLFVLNQPLDRAIEEYRSQFIRLRRERKWKEYGELTKRVGAIYQLMKDFMGDSSEPPGSRAACQVRVVYDKELHQPPQEVGFVSGDSELAFYDDFRFDIFGGGKKGVITDLTIRSRGTEGFRHLFEEFEKYFVNLWNNGSDAREFLEELLQAREYAIKRIDYGVSQWLFQYEHQLRPEDKVLKEEELAAVKRAIKAYKRGKFKAYLDVGTCTGRYPFSLAGLVEKRGKILGVDNDPDCIAISEWQRNDNDSTSADARFRFEVLDFLNPDFPQAVGGKFDLITCMLGTISHFAWVRNLRWRENPDPLQRALARFTGLLEPGGLLILGSWSALACLGKKFLQIYSDDDCDRLKEWTPNSIELRERLGHAGLAILRWECIEERMDLYVCQASKTGARAATENVLHREGFAPEESS
jgi:hypothetical protein